MEIDELENLLNRIDESFSNAINTLKTTIGSGHKFVIIGVGKCHNIGHKIAATLNSTGAPTVVLNSQNALHGDLDRLYLIECFWRWFGSLARPCLGG